MGRKLFIAGNWKMNLSRDEAVALASGLAERVGTVEGVDLAVAPFIEPGMHRFFRRRGDRIELHRIGLDSHYRAGVCGQQDVRNLC